MKPFERPPFLSPLEDTAYKDKIKRLQHKPGVIVRQEKAFRYDKDKLEKEIKKFAQNKKLFKEWRDAGIKVVSFDTVFSQAEKNGWVEAYIVTEDIIGKNADEIFYDEQNYLKLDEEISNVLSILTSYYERKIAQGGDFINDVKWAQFVFGSKKGQLKNENSLYYVDVEPFYNHGDAGKPISLHMVYALRNLVDLLHHAVVKRKRLKNNAPFPEKWLEVLNQQTKIISSIEGNLSSEVLMKTTYEQLKDDIKSCAISMQNLEFAKKYSATA